MCFDARQKLFQMERARGSEHPFGHLMVNNAERGEKITTGPAQTGQALVRPGPLRADPHNFLTSAQCIENNILQS